MKILTPSEVQEFIVHSLMCDPPEIPYVSGPPGIGKSDLYASVARMFNLKLITEYLSQKLPEDMTGLPRYNEETQRAEYVPFGTFPLVGDSLPLDENGDEMEGWLVLLDEFADANDEVWSASYPILLKHEVGGHKIHPKALICGAGNRSTDSAMARELPDTLITRMLICEMTVSAKDWVKWGRDLGDKGNERVVDFIEKNPDMLLGKLTEREELQSYQTPRGWGKVISIVNTHNRLTLGSLTSETTDAGKPLTPTAMFMIDAAVGGFGAKAFEEYYNDTLKIPLVWDIAQAPSGAIIPPTTLGKATVTSNLVKFYAESMDNDQTRKGVLQYMNRMPSEHAAVFVDALIEALGDTQSAKSEISIVRNVLGVDLLNS